MAKTYIAVDNGVSGSIAVIYPSGEYLFEITPTKTEQSYTKAKQNISRINSTKLYSILVEWMGKAEMEAEGMNSEILVVMERPLVNPMRFKATMSGIRALEATLVVVESLSLPFQYLDSKGWQKALLPSGIVGAPELKKASLDIGSRMFPKIQTKHKDRDSILMAEFARRSNL